MSVFSEELLLACALSLAVSCTALPMMSASETGRDVACESGLEDGAGQIFAKEGLMGTSLFLPTQEIGRQLTHYPGSVCPDRALGIAVRAILEDEGGEALGSVRNELGERGCDARCYFGRPTSLFGIVAGNRAHPQDRLLPAAPAEGAVKEYWTFFLSVPDLSEHGYWALVARDGSGVEVVSEN